MFFWYRLTASGIAFYDRLDAPQPQNLPKKAIAAIAEFDVADLIHAETRRRGDTLPLTALVRGGRT